jgi:Uncharacterized protein containing a Zn-ribbon (DUF2116).
MEKRHCLHCGQVITGRVDKKYCDDACRSSYNNQINRKNYQAVRKVNRVLAKNRRILAEFYQRGETEISRAELHWRGFDFARITSCRSLHNRLHFQVYDYAYYLCKSNRIHILYAGEGVSENNPGEDV